ncbi:dTDP-4-dehydrorhamnose reductase [Aquipuribacter sp. SD81]|uniref:dTDP-4-dehydrorhamnose reductase n=1 Tax=Aquipuribacter sp. SD81 TaxID=3127703 RepID=UPI003019F33E
MPVTDETGPTAPPPAAPGRWLVTGASGMLGSEVVRRLTALGHDVTAATRADLDVTDEAAVRAAVGAHDVVVNAAAHTAVDAAETEEASAFAVNATGPHLLARACAGAGVPLLHVSTDYVFAGDGTVPYPEDAPARPASAYGRTKAAGEWAVAASGARAWVLRTAWLYGAGHPCFPRSIARAARSRDVLQVVDDQVGQPTWVGDLAQRVVDTVVAGVPFGTYHATATGQVSWHGLALAVVAAAGRPDVVVEPVSSATLARPAPRPAWSVLGHDAWHGTPLGPMRAWETAFAEAVAGGLLE